MINLPRYTRKDATILLCTVIPFVVILNSIIFSDRYFTEWRTGIIATLVGIIVIGTAFIAYGHIAVVFRHRFPSDNDFFKKTMLMILLFLLMSALLIFAMFSFYQRIGLLGNNAFESSFGWAYVATGILNIFLTFLHEGISRFEGWKAELQETEQLKMAYKQSQLIGLKSQINPHVLFNSLNSLSGLIQEDTEKAEQFLDQMSKVYRYMLRNEEEKLVTVQTEIQFINSYFSLLKARYNEAINLNVKVTESDRLKFIPPLSLQVIIENALFQNKVGKACPLSISIRSVDGNTLEVSNGLQRKVMTDTIDYEAGLDNLVKKYQLLNQPNVEILEKENDRIIILPLIVQEGALS
jgi:two-component system LytT family sensor kinase